MTLTEQYNNGRPDIPLNGRYNVIMEIKGYRTILEKKISINKGNNYLPVFGLRHFKIPFMDFKMTVQDSEIRFIYDNNILVDTLRKIDYKLWLGKLFYKNKFVDWFWLKGK